jgi:hypothetical protein
MRDIKSLLLVLLSAGLICTWVYHLYDKTMYSQRRTEVYIKDSIAVAEGIRDSLQKIYTVRINNLGGARDSLQTELGQKNSELGKKMTEIRSLEKEIATLLGKKGATPAELKEAKRKIDQLQEMVEELRTQNTSMESEQTRLLAVMDQLNGDIKGLEQNMVRLGEENKALTEKINMASVFIASEVKLAAVTVKGSREEETMQAKKAKKFVLSFVLQNNINEYNGAEVFVVITDPDGEVIRNLDWESRTIPTRNEGEKEYTLKVRFDYEKGEQKYQVFTVDGTEFKKGNYNMHIYHNGYRIGRVVKTLS